MDNTQKGNHVVNRNTAWGNGGSGFDFEDSTPIITVSSYNSTLLRLDSDICHSVLLV